HRLGRSSGLCRTAPETIASLVAWRAGAVLSHASSGRVLWSEFRDRLSGIVHREYFDHRLGGARAGQAFASAIAVRPDRRRRARATQCPPAPLELVDRWSRRRLGS